MCSCGKNKNASCGGKVSQLKNVKSRITTLYRLETNPTLKSQHKQMMDSASEKISLASSFCPSDEEINVFKSYWNEYSIRN